jgi:hypothetical protein
MSTTTKTTEDKKEEVVFAKSKLDQEKKFNSLKVWAFFSFSGFFPRSSLLIDKLNCFI